jgi:hypothetical protein
MHMTRTLTLADLTAWTGLDVLDHLEREVTILVIAGLQAQGDLIVVPAVMLGTVTESPYARWHQVPPTGIELLRSAAGGNPHTLVADAGTCWWTTEVSDLPERLALGIVEATAVAYLIHPEHGGTGLAPGRYVIRRQRERNTGTAWRDSLSRRGDRLIAD